MPDVHEVAAVAAAVAPHELEQRAVPRARCAIDAPRTARRARTPGPTAAITNATNVNMTSDGDALRPRR